MERTEKLYDLNAYVKTFYAVVESCVPAGEKYEIVLNRTAFYPEGGGQPSDIGVLNCMNVLDVQERGDVIVHITDRSLPAGSAVLGGINWLHRFALMQQHTGEHIVSGIANRLFGVDNVGFHMGNREMTVDWNGILDENQLSLIQDLANEAVYQNVAVRAYYPAQEELEKMEYRSKKALSGAVRIVRIPGYDVCACCGTHVARTGEIGAIKMLGFQRYKGGTRVSLMCGAQAMSDYDRKQRDSAALSALLSAKPEEAVSSVERLLTEKDDLKRKLSSLRDELFRLKAEALPENCGGVCRFEEELSPDDLRRFALLLSERCGAAAVFSGGGPSGYRYALADSRGEARLLGKELNRQFQGRGGGSKELVQGSLSGSRTDILEFFCKQREDFKNQVNSMQN